MKSKNVNMLSGSISKGLLSLMIPIMIMNVMERLFGIADMITLRYFANDTAVGAVGSTATLVALFTSLSIGLAAGANVVIAKRVGAGHRNSACEAVKTSLLFAVATGLLMLVIGVGFAKPFMRMTNCPESLFEAAVIYFRVTFYGIPILVLYHFSAAILRAIGDTKRPMYYLIIGGFVKVIFTVLFVSVFKMTVDGVALATIVSNTVACTLSVVTLLRSEVITGGLRQVRARWHTLGEVLYNGLPAGLQGVMYSFANLSIVTTVNGFGADAATGISIANHFDGIIYQICYSPSLAVTPYVAQNIGAHNPKRARQTLSRALVITALFGIGFGSLSVAFSGQLSYLMSPSPAIIAYSQQKMWLVSGTYFICGINDVIAGSFRGMGKPLLPTACSLAFLCAFRFLWVYAIYPFLPQTIFCLYLVWPISWLLSIIVLSAAYMPTVKKLQRQMSPQSGIYPL